MGFYAGSGSAIGVYGDSGSSFGVLGVSGSSTAVYGSSASTTLPAVVGYSFHGSTGLQGYSGAAVSSPASPVKTGVFGSADTDEASVGVRGRSPTGRGGVFGGKLAQLRLSPSGASTHPASGQRGDLFVDSSGRLWFCKGGTTWKQLA